MTDTGTVAGQVDRSIGPHDLPVRIYMPRSGLRFCFTLFVHGGGFSWGPLDDYDSICRNLVAATAGVVVSVGYPLAPQHPFPAGLDDVVEAAHWTVTQAEDLADAGAPFILAGDSAGGCLTAGAAQRLRDERGPAIDGQLLIYPMIEYHDRTPAGFHELARHFRPSFDDIRGAWEHDLPSPTHVIAPYAIPSRTPDLTGLPPTLMLTAAEDPLSLEGQAYARQLKAAGVVVQERCYEGVGHSFLAETSSAPKVQAAMDDIAAWVKELHGRRAGRPPTWPKRDG